MSRRSSRNLGAVHLRTRRRSTDPMKAYDALPAPLRRWLSEAALPWSPGSAKRVWTRAVAKGLTDQEALAVLAKAEAHTLARNAPTPMQRRDYQA